MCGIFFQHDPLHVSAVFIIIRESRGEYNVPLAKFGALDVCDLCRGGGLDLAESLFLVNSMFSENITMELVGFLHLPVEGTGGGEKSIDRLQRSVSGFGVD